jgi:AraC-like DNA-binding protein
MHTRKVGQMVKAMTVRDVLNYIEDNFATGIDINDIAQFSGYSRRHIQALLKQYIGMPIGLYIRKRRIIQASYLLRLTNINVIDISLKLGFDSQQSFCREFKKATGYTPGQYRRKDSWDLSSLYSHSHVQGVTINSLQFCNLPEGIVSGSHYNHIIPIPPTPTSHVNRLNIIFEKLDKEKKDIIVLNDFMPHENYTNCLKLNTIIGTKNETMGSSYNQCRYPSGTFACFSFQFTLHDYPSYSKYIYLVLLPKYKLTRRPGYDIEIFHYPSHSELSDTINCTYFIPIEPPLDEEVLPHTL